MKELTEEEFSDRMMAMQRSRAIFVETGLTKNITHAFAAYQTIFAEREREIFLANVSGSKPRTIMDKYYRPKCVECGADMAFRQLPENDEGTKIQLVCMNDNCDTVLNSTNDLKWWMDNLRIKGNEAANGFSGTFKGVDEIKQERRDPRRSRGVS